MMKSERPLIKRIAPLLIVVAVLVAAAAVAVPTIAYYIQKSNAEDGKYGPAKSGEPIVVMPDASVEGVTVKVEDEGYPVYVRAIVVINWQGADGKYVAFSPVGYSIQHGGDWVPVSLGDNMYMYYYTKPVASGGVTTELISKCSVSSEGDTSTTGYSLRIEVITQTVQAIGTENDEFGWRDAWKDGPSTWPQQPTE